MVDGELKFQLVKLMKNNIQSGNNQFRRWGLRNSRGIMAVAAGFALLVWVIDAMLDYFVFYQGYGTFLELLVTHPPAHEIFIRLVILICFIVFGSIVSFHSSKRKQIEVKLKKSNRLFATLSQINQTIVREHDQQKLFQEICNICIEFGKFRLAWIGFVDEKNKSVNPVAFSGEGSDYLQNIEISVTDGLTGKGPSGRAIREEKSVVFNDLENNPDFAPWRKQAIEKGYHSSASFPIRLNNNVIGVLGIYAVEAHFFDEDEVKLLEEAALDISFALDIIQDEENRKRAEEALRDSEEKYHFLYENALVGIGISDSTGKILEANETMCQIMGYNSDELSKVRLADTYFISESRKDILGKLKKDGHVENYEVQLYNKNKVIYWANLSSKKIMFENQEAILSTVIDITEFKQSEKNLKTEKAFSEKIINTSSAIIIGLNADHEIQLFNEGAEVITGYKRKDILGKDWFKLFFPPEMIDEMNKIWKDSWGIKAHSYTNPILTKNGDQKMISWQSTGMYEGENEKQHLLISIGEDITERVRAEEEIQKHQNHLEELVKERTRELETKNKDLERFNNLFVGREFRIKELRDKVKEMEKRLGNK